MADFYFYGRRVPTIFQLLPTFGQYEDDMSRAVGWVLSQCPPVLDAFLAKTLGHENNDHSVAVNFQVIDKKTGRTDLEIESGGTLHVIVEAKRGWELPSTEQLGRYAKRLTSSKAQHKRIVVLTDCAKHFADAHLPALKADGISVLPLSWAELAQLASDHKEKCGIHQRYLIDELLKYLKGMITMQQIDSNWVYVLSLGSSTPPNWKIGWIEIVTKKHKYFHPVGTNGWPGVPPNYIAFRYYSELQSIHRIEGFEVVDDLNGRFPEIPKGVIDEPHFVYSLGPAFRPDHKVPTGSKITWAARRWCMLDTLFTCETISDACRVSKEREAAAPEFAPR